MLLRVLIRAYVWDRTHFQRVGYLSGAMGRLRASWEVGDRAGSPTWRRPREAAVEQFGYRWVREISCGSTPIAVVESRPRSDTAATITRRLDTFVHDVRRSTSGDYIEAD